MGNRAYIICTSPRSGSTLLCRLLAGTRQCGIPDSYFHQASLTGWLADYGLAQKDFTTRHAALRAVFDAAIREGRGTSEWFGLRLQQHSFGFFLEQLGVLYPTPNSDLARIEAAFGACRFIYLKRDDKLAQAISYVKAQQSGLWHKAPDGSELERLSPPQALVYDPKATACQISAFEAADAAWQMWFAQTGVKPFAVRYEALAADPGGVLASVLEYLGCDPSLAQRVAVPVAKLADDLSAEWAMRYTADAR